MKAAIFFSFFAQHWLCLYEVPFYLHPAYRLDAAFFFPVNFCFGPLLPLDSGWMLQFRILKSKH